MQALTLQSREDHVVLKRLAIAVFICILVLHGTHIRSRSSADAPTVDWVVLARITACATGFGFALVLVREILPLGFGARMLLLYGLATVISAIRCPYRASVLGYSMLLCGVSLLMIALVYTARHRSRLQQIESVWFATITVLVIKDTITSLLMSHTLAGEGAARLGMNVTHPNQLSLLAVILFWLSFGNKRRQGAVALWGLRLFLIYVLLGAKTRISMVAFVIAGLCHTILSARYPFRRVAVVGAVGGTLVTFVLLSLLSGQPWATDSLEYLTRGQDTAELRSLTGRAEIWQRVLPRTLDTPISGHGYGVSRFAIGWLGDGDADTGWQADHCHNMVIEVFFSTGLLGLVPFVLMVLYSLRWVVRFPRLCQVFSPRLAAHAACTIVALLATSFSEAKLCVSMSPFQPLFFFYLVMLDRELCFTKPRRTGTEPVVDV